MRAYVIFIIFILHLFGCKPKQTTIDFSLNKVGYLTIPITIQDTTIDFIFDTGSNGSFIDSIYLDKRVINHKDTILVSATYLEEGYKKYFRTYPQKFSIGDISASRRIPFIAANIFDNQALIATDVIGQFCWRFNFKTKKVTVSKYSIKIDNLSNEWLRIPYKIQNGKFKIHTYLNDSIDIGDILFDTGAQKCLSGGGMLILDCSTPYDSVILNQLIEKICISGSTRYFQEKGNPNSWCFGFDSIRLFGYPSYNCWIRIAGNTNRKETYHCALTLSYIVQQFSEMYIDSRKKIMYLKPF